MAVYSQQEAEVVLCGSYESQEEACSLLVTSHLVCCSSALNGRRVSIQGASPRLQAHGGVLSHHIPQLRGTAAACFPVTSVCEERQDVNLSGVIICEITDSHKGRERVWFGIMNRNHLKWKLTTLVLEQKDIPVCILCKGCLDALTTMH